MIARLTEMWPSAGQVCAGFVSAISAGGSWGNESLSVYHSMRSTAFTTGQKVAKGTSWRTVVLDLCRLPHNLYSQPGFP